MRSLHPVLLLFVTAMFGHVQLCIEGIRLVVAAALILCYILLVKVTGDGLVLYIHRGAHREIRLVRYICNWN